MPELPEVETIARKLKQVLPGKTIQAVTPLHKKTFIGDTSQLINQKITDVTRQAKIIRIHLTNSLSLIVHLKMTGQLIYTDPSIRLGGGHPTADWVNNLPSKHTRFMFEFDQGAKLFFNDQRLFGWIKLLPDADVDELFTGLAPDVIDAKITTEYLLEKLGKRSQNIKQLIMDTAIMGGVGNIYACDALNVAKISPFRTAKSLSLVELDTLLKSLKTVILTGIELGGTTFDGKYVDTEGMAGKYQSVVRVYGREGKPCLNCGSPILKAKINGRGTYYCSTCQV